MKADIAPDRVLVEIADYVMDFRVASDSALENARYCLVDSIGNALEALDHPDCVKLLGPAVPGAEMARGARVPGTPWMLDPAAAAFNTSCMVRWTDFSDTYVAITTCHPSDDLGAVLCAADYLARNGRKRLKVKDVLGALVKAHEIQGALGAGNRFNDHGIDHVLMNKVGSTAVVTKMLGGTREQVIAAVSLAFFNPGLCIHRFGTNTGPRKGWAGAEAASDAVRLAMMAVKGEPGYPQVLTHLKWGFEKSFLGGKELKLGFPLGTRVMENVLFKIQGPVVIHAQSAIECAIKVHPMVKGRLNDIAEIRLASHARTLSAIDKTGPLRNAAARDHCLQYAVAILLIHGRLTSEDYEDKVAADPRIDRLRNLMTVAENPAYTASYQDTTRGANPNSIEVRFKDGTTTGLIEVEYPIGHPRRRKEGIPLLIGKFRGNLARRYPPARVKAIEALCMSRAQLERMPVNEFTDMLKSKVESRKSKVSRSKR